MTPTLVLNVQIKKLKYPMNTLLSLNPKSILNGLA